MDAPFVTPLLLVADTVTKDTSSMIRKRLATRTEVLTIRLHHINGFILTDKESDSDNKDNKDTEPAAPDTEEEEDGIVDIATELEHTGITTGDTKMPTETTIVTTPPLATATCANSDTIVRNVKTPTILRPTNPTRSAKLVTSN